MSTSGTTLWQTRIHLCPYKIRNSPACGTYVTLTCVSVFLSLKFTKLLVQSLKTVLLTFIMILNRFSKLLSRWRMRIYVGTHHLLLRTNTESVHRVKRLIPHPNFQHTSKGYDIGLIEIKPPVKFSSTAKPICLPSSDKEASTRDTCFATGWGLTKGLFYKV